MTTKTEQQEPTMEEILASIRRIISEENEGEEEAAVSDGVAAPAENGADHAEDKAPEGATPETENIAAEEADSVDDVLELTEVVEDDDMPADEETDLDVELETDSAVNEAVEPEAPEAEDVPEIDFEPETGLESEAGPKAEPDAEQAEIAAAVSEHIEEQLSDWDDPVDPADDKEALTSDKPSEQARKAFQDLSELLVAGYQGSDNTLESMVRQMLKPMLKAWLDENLPGMVERMVSREIARLSRSKKP